MVSTPKELNFTGYRRLPVLLSSEASECGIACLAMIGRYYGHDVDLNGLRQRFPMSLAGATLRTLMGAADQLGFGSRALKVELDQLSKLQLPAILHWDLSHFVVLKRADRRGAVVHDPAKGEVRLSLGEVSNHFTGVALEVTPSTNFEPITARKKIRLNSLWSKSHGLGNAVTQIVALSVVLQIVAFATPLQIQLLVDQAIGRNDRELLAVLALGFGALIIIQAAVEAARAWALQVFSNMMTFQMICNIVRHMMRLRSEFFEKRHVGDIISRINSSSYIQDILTRGAISALLDGAMAVISAVILLFYSPLLAGLVIAAVAINLVVAFALYPSIRSRTEEQLVVAATERSHLMETVRAATTIKMMGGEVERESAWRNLYGKVVNANVYINRLKISGELIQTVCTGVSLVIVLFWGGRMVLAGAGMSVGMLMAFLSFRQTFSDRMTGLINEAVQFRLLQLHLARVGDIVAAEPELPTSGASATLQVAGQIEARQVSFRYGVGERCVLNGLNLSVAPCEFVAITGRSGGGKSTLLKLLLGLHTPTAGEILLDGQAASPERWRAWRARIGVVAQEDRLLSGSIADNISFFDPALDMSRVHAAAHAAQLHDDVMRMPMQYLSLVGDMGAALSGGQRQRLLLARALYRRPAILILDEGTANLDPATEELLAELISSLPMTRIVVAHRPALIVRADRVLDLNDGVLTSARAAAHVQNSSCAGAAPHAHEQSA